MWTFREIYHFGSKVINLSFYAKFNCLDRWHSIAWLRFNVVSFSFTRSIRRIAKCVACFCHVLWWATIQKFSGLPSRVVFHWAGTGPEGLSTARGRGLFTTQWQQGCSKNFCPGLLAPWARIAPLDQRASWCASRRPRNGGAHKSSLHLGELVSEIVSSWQY